MITVPPTVVCLGWWRQVDFGAATVRPEPGTTKNRAGRMFPFTPELRALLAAQRAYTATVRAKTGRIIPHVFHREGKPIKSFRGAWLSACKAAREDLPRLPPDRNLKRAGVPPRGRDADGRAQDGGDLSSLRDRERRRPSRGG